MEDALAKQARCAQTRIYLYIYERACPTYVHTHPLAVCQRVSEKGKCINAGRGRKKKSYNNVREKCRRQENDEDDLIDERRARERSSSTKRRARSDSRWLVVSHTTHHHYHFNHRLIMALVEANSDLSRTASRLSPAAVRGRLRCAPTRDSFPLIQSAAAVG